MKKKQILVITVIAIVIVVTIPLVIIFIPKDVRNERSAYEKDSLLNAQDSSLIYEGPVEKKVEYLKEEEMKVLSKNVWEMFVLGRRWEITSNHTYLKGENSGYFHSVGDFFNLNNILANYGLFLEFGSFILLKSGFHNITVFPTNESWYTGVAEGAYVLFIPNPIRDFSVYAVSLSNFDVQEAINSKQFKLYYEIEVREELESGIYDLQNMMVGWIKNQLIGRGPLPVREDQVPEETTIEFEDFPTGYFEGAYSLFRNEIWYSDGYTNIRSYSYGSRVDTANRFASYGLEIPLAPGSIVVMRTVYWKACYYRLEITTTGVATCTTTLGDDIVIFCPNDSDNVYIIELEAFNLDYAVEAGYGKVIAEIQGTNTPTIIAT